MHSYLNMYSVCTFMLIIYAVKNSRININKIDVENNEATITVTAATQV